MNSWVMRLLQAEHHLELRKLCGTCGVLRGGLTVYVWNVATRVATRGQRMMFSWCVSTYTMRFLNSKGALGGRQRHCSRNKSFFDKVKDVFGGG